MASAAISKTCGANWTIRVVTALLATILFSFVEHTLRGDRVLRSPGQQWIYAINRSTA